MIPARHYLNRPALFRLCSASLLALALASAQPLLHAEGKLILWPRGKEAYLVAGLATPIWPALPEELKDDTILTITLPKGFSLVAAGESRAFGLHPKPLAIPSKIENTGSSDASVYRLFIPKSELEKEGMKRLSLMVQPEETISPGDYSCKISTELAGKTISLSATFHVLEPLQGKRPRRLTLGVYNYHGYTSEAYAKALEEAVVKSGINTICDMRSVEEGISLTPALKKRGLQAEIYWFWNAFAKRVAGEVPEILALNEDRVTDHKATPAAATWIIANEGTVMPLLEKDVKAQLRDGFYKALVNDNEIRGMNREGTLAYGDIHNPGAMQAFAKWAKLDETVPPDPKLIASEHGKQWVDYRCWQSAQLSRMLSEAIHKSDPTASYGFYSGYQHGGRLAGFSRQLYSVDWHNIATEGKVDFGCAGYYGSPVDLASTQKALGEAPYIPAEMYMEHFSEKRRTMPTPDEFALRLAAALMDSGGKGGVTLWYLPVFDGAAFSAVSRVSQWMAEIEAFLLDGERLSTEALRLSNNVDPDSIFAWALGERRLVVFLNRAKKPLHLRFGWTNPLPKPDTVDVLTGRSYGAAPLVEATLKPTSFAAFITASEGN